MSSQFGFSWQMLIAQVVFLVIGVIHLVLAIRATIVSSRTFDGFLALGWILLSWLLPVVGPIAALVAARRHMQMEAQNVG